MLFWYQTGNHKASVILLIIKTLLMSTHPVCTTDAFFCNLNKVVLLMSWRSPDILKQGLNSFMIVSQKKYFRASLLIWVTTKGSIYLTKTNLYCSAAVAAFHSHILLLLLLFKKSNLLCFHLSRYQDAVCTHLVYLVCIWLFNQPKLHFLSHTDQK